MSKKRLEFMIAVNTYADTDAERSNALPALNRMLAGASTFSGGCYAVIVEIKEQTTSNAHAAGEGGAMSKPLPRLVSAMVASNPCTVVYAITPARNQRPCVSYSPTLQPPYEPKATGISKHQYAYALSTTDAEGDARVLILYPEVP